MSNWGFNDFPPSQRYAGIDEFDVNNGTGFGVTLFVQGCTHHCPECHNPSTWDFDGGKPFDIDTSNRLFDTLSDPNIMRLTLSGGDPFDNLMLSLFVSKHFKSMYPNKKLWIYTGYTFDDLINNNEKKELLQLCDVLVDGKYENDKRDLSLRFIGSSNQRIIDVANSLKSNTIVNC